MEPARSAALGRGAARLFAAPGLLFLLMVGCDPFQPASPQAEEVGAVRPIGPAEGEAAAGDREPCAGEPSASAAVEPVVERPDDGAPAVDWHDVALRSPDAGLRAEAVAALSLDRDEEAVEVLLSTARDPDPHVRFRSIEALGRIAADLPQLGEPIEAALALALRDPEPSVRRVAEAVRAAAAADGGVRPSPE